MCNCSESNSNLGWKEHLETIRSEPWLKAGSGKSGAKDHVWMSFEYLRRWRFYHLSGQPLRDQQETNDSQLNLFQNHELGLKSMKPSY